MSQPIDNKARREEKLKSTLRSNLQKRKNQARARAETGIGSNEPAKDHNQQEPEQSEQDRQKKDS